jgi:hypothetical protein
MKSFMELYLTGQISKDKVDDFIDQWHNDTSIEWKLSLYLGMSDKMYAMFVETPREFFERYTPDPPTLIDKQNKQ